MAGSGKNSITDVEDPDNDEDQANRDNLEPLRLTENGENINLADDENERLTESAVPIIQESSLVMSENKTANVTNSVNNFGKFELIQMEESFF